MWLITRNFRNFDLVCYRKVGQEPFYLETIYLEVSRGIMNIE